MYKDSASSIYWVSQFNDTKLIIEFADTLYKTIIHCNNDNWVEAGIALYNKMRLYKKHDLIRVGVIENPVYLDMKNLSISVKVGQLTIQNFDKLEYHFNKAKELGAFI